MTDLVVLARRRVSGSPAQSHWEGCECDHTECLIQRMADEIERLRVLVANDIVRRVVALEDRMNNLESFWE